MSLIDSHAHLTSSNLFDKLPEILERAKSANISKIVNICTDQSSLEKGLALSLREPWIKNTFAVTPHEAKDFNQETVELIELQSKNLVAIGETGLDYFYEHSPKEVQKESFTAHLRLAIENFLPVVIHCRDAFSDLFAILDNSYLSDPRNRSAVLHCFTGTKDEAKQALDRGLKISFSGIVTFKKSTALAEVAKYVPLESMLIETDSPYLSPQKHRGQENEPAFLVETAHFLADLKNLPFETFAQATSSNTEKLFF